MALRAHCGFALLGVLGVIVLAYLRLTILKIDPTQEPTETQPARDLSKDSESFAANRLRNLDDHQCEILSIQLKEFAAQRFWVIAETGLYAPESEQMKVGQRLRKALHAAGWVESQFVLQRQAAPGFKSTKMAPYSRGGDSGVVIRADRASIPAGRRLNAVLNELSVQSSLEPDDTMKNAILVFVGDE
jgi:hypothetical protein